MPSAADMDAPLTRAPGARTAPAEYASTVAARAEQSIRRDTIGERLEERAALHLVSTNCLTYAC